MRCGRSPTPLSDGRLARRAGFSRISHVIAGQRDRLFLVSKVETNLVTGDGVARACEASLARLGADYLDLYLLH